MRNFLFFFLTTLPFLISCNKQNIDIESCEEIPLPSGISTGYQWTKVLPYYNLPYFNPNNSDEIILREHKNYGDTIFQLLKFNIKTQEKQVIYQGLFGPRPRWNRKDWILLNLSDYNIYKIKSNGDSLTQLTNQGSCLGGEWNISGDKFIYEHNTVGGNLWIISDDSGIPLDTIFSGSSIEPSWQHDSLIVNTKPEGITIFNPQTEEYKYIDSYRSTSAAEWLDEENVIWAGEEGILKTNINSEQTELLIESCNAKKYVMPTVSFQSQKIIFQREDKIVTETNKGMVSSTLMIMNFDGSCIEEVEMPN